MQPPVEIRYAGVVIGKADAVRTEEAEADRFFLVFHDPLPVGSLLDLRAADTRAQARVEGVVELAEGAGMRVRLLPGAETGTHAAVDAPAPVETSGIPEVVAGSQNGGVDSSIEASAAIDVSGPIEAGETNGASKKKPRKRRR